MSINPDMQGYIVRLSNFITHIGAAILIATSTRSPRSYYALLFLQIFFILLGVLISIRRNQISISDAEFAVLLTRSPISTYCVLFVLPRLFINTLAPKVHNAVWTIRRLPGSRAWSEFKACLSSRAVFDGCCGALILLLCLVLDLSVRFNPSSKIYSPVPCAAGECWSTQVQLDIGTVYRWAALVIASLIIYECILIRHKELRWKLMRTLSARYPSLRKSAYWKRGVCGFGATWYIAAKLHPWIPFAYVAILFEGWARKLNLWTIETGFVLSFGQFLALGPAVPVVWECMTIAIRNHTKIRKIPKLFIRDVGWLLSGEGEPWGVEEPELDDMWKAFPPDVVAAESGLPIHATQSPSARKPPRRRRQRRVRMPEPMMLPEIDLGEISLTEFTEYVQ